MQVSDCSSAEGSSARQARNLPSRVVVACPYGAAYRARLESIFGPAETTFVDPQDSRALHLALRDADIAVLKDAPGSEILQYESLSWVHCNMSGLDGCATPEIVGSDLIVTSASGRSASVLAEHAIYFMLALVYDAPTFLRAQRRRVWGARQQKRLRGLEGRSVLVVGMGHTAKALIPRCQALGMNVSAYRRSAAGDEGFGIPVGSRAAGDRLEDRLSKIDVIALAASLNDTSHEMLGETQFDAVRRGALVVNVARARLMNTSAMKAALRDGRLGGAGLDVTDPEPLPPWDGLWRYRNVLITPHVTPKVADRAGAEIDIIEDNYSRFLAGSPLRNVLRPEDVYTLGSTMPRARFPRLAEAWSSWARPTATGR